MQRYMVPVSLENFQETPIHLDGDSFHHMKNVMRFKPETKVYLADPNGKSCVAEILSFSSTTVELGWVENESMERELPVMVTLACGLSKGDKLEWVVQKGTELGMAAIVPFDSKYSVVRWDGNKAKKKQERFQKIAQEAAEQSHRTQVPLVTEMMKINQLVGFAADFDHKLIAYEEEAKKGELGRFARTMRDMKKGEKILLVFGPEGGLDPAEIDTLVAEGFLTCGLGPRILRAETAPLYALAAISYHFELQSEGE